MQVRAKAGKLSATGKGSKGIILWGLLASNLKFHGLYLLGHLNNYLSAEAIH